MYYYLVIAASTNNFSVIGIYMSYSNAKIQAHAAYNKQDFPAYEYLIYQLETGKTYDLNQCHPHYIVSEDQIPW